MIIEILESAEDYLEAMLICRQERGYCRNVDLSRRLGVTKASVTKAVRLLVQKELVEVNDDGFLYFTPRGEEMARNTYQRHQELTAWLTALGVTPAVAEQDACRMEHIISEETFQTLRRHCTGHSCEKSPEKP